MSRADGRSSSTLRPIIIALESLDRVDGSAAFAFGETKVLASVSGPIQVRLASEHPSKATFEVLVRPLSGIPGTDSKSLGAILRTLLASSLVLTQNPRTLIQLVLQSLTPGVPNSDPSLTAAFINASTLALLRTASFPMLGVVCAAAVGRAKEQDNMENSRSDLFLLDPTEQELHQCDAMGCVAVMFGASGSSADQKGVQKLAGEKEQMAGEIVWSSFRGAPLQSDYDQLLRLAKVGATSIYNAMRDRFREVVEETGVDAARHAKKMPRNKGGRVVMNVDTENAMDTT